jgi:hypothetical protein
MFPRRAVSPALFFFCIQGLDSKRACVLAHGLLLLSIASGASLNRALQGRLLNRVLPAIRLLTQGDCWQAYAGTCLSRRKSRPELFYEHRFGASSFMISPGRYEWSRCRMWGRLAFMRTNEQARSMAV